MSQFPIINTNQKKKKKSSSRSICTASKPLIPTKEDTTKQRRTLPNN